MSDVLKSRVTTNKAMNFNAQQNGYIPPAAVKTYPGLATDKGSTTFLAAVVSFQMDCGLAADGFFGLRTQQMLTQRFAPLEDFLVIGGVRTPIDTAGKFSILDYTEDSRLDLHSFGNFSKRKKPVQRVVLHHGGYDPFHLAAVFATRDRKVSSHLGLGFTDSGDILVAQYLDLSHTAWHAGKMNEGSIGIDFAVQPTTDCARRYNLPIIKNPSTIGPAMVLEFPDRLLDAMAQLVQELHRVFELGAVTPMPEADMRYAPSAHAKITVLGHHHFATNGKFDVSYIWDRLNQRFTSPS